MIPLSPEISCATLLAARAASSCDAMSFGKILGAPHFFQATDGSLKFEAAVAVGGEKLGIGVGSGEQLHLMFVERIDQGYEACGFIAHVASHDRNPDDDHRVVAPGDGKI